MGIPDIERVWTASLHLDSIASECCYAIERDVGLLTWPHFSEFVNMRLAPPASCHNRLAELKELRHIDIMEDD
jgi:hypothetical protein